MKQVSEPGLGRPKLAFVESKHYSAEDLASALASAFAANQHTNFGPVSLELERSLSELNGLNQARAACCTSNGTVALQAAVSSFANHFGRPLRWLISDFGFMTSFIGPFVNQQWVECRQDGFISVDNLRKADLSSFDAVLATNVFGLHEDFDELFAFCREHRKALLIDNAAGFRSLAPHHAAAAPDDDLLWAEAISLHHTKPWGMGEGGAVFLPASLLPTCRHSLNFGIGGGRFLGQLEHCTNGKMSEISAAQILLRVRDHVVWTPAYREQAERILELGGKAGLMPLLAELPKLAVPGQIAFLSSRPVSFERLQAQEIPILKYYRPGPASGGIARRLYDHALNVPCHGQMADVPDHKLADIFSKLA